jgi:hypothetical protein
METFKIKTMNMKYKIIAVWDCIRYDIPRFMKNIWTFRKGLWNFRWYDPHGVYVLNNVALTTMADNVELYGIEVDSSRLKKVASMRKAAQLYQNFVESNFIDQAEAELGELIMNPFEWESLPEHDDYMQMVDKDTPEEKAHNKAVFDRAREIEEQQWDELHKLLKGQDYTKFKKKKSFDDQFDGSGLRGWWD